MSKRYILYLEPSRSNLLGEAVRDFYEKSKIFVGINEAQQYIPHCSITGFFQTSTEPDVNQLDVLCNAIEESLQKLDFSVRVGKVALGAHDVVPGNDRILTIPSARIELKTAGLRELAEMVKLKMSKVGVKIRPKPADHISLAYMASYPLSSVSGDNYQFSSSVDSQKSSLVDFNAQKYLDVAKEHFKNSLIDSSDWDLALYEEAHSLILSAPHKFSQVKRWSLKINLSKSTYPDR
jgi:hypothetical protein